MGQQVYMPLNWIQFKILNGLDVVEIHIMKICNKLEVFPNVSCVVFFKIYKTNMKLFHII